MNILDVAKDLVERARLGDQVATAQIALCSQEAARGVLQARLGKAAIEDYIAKHPAASMGAEPPPGPIPPQVLQDAWTAETPAGLLTCLLVLLKYEHGFEAACVLLAHKMRIRGAHLSAMGDLLPAEETRAVFLFGAKFPHTQPNLSLPKTDCYAFMVGQMLGTAHRIQYAARKGTPLTPLNPMMGWENGEES